jgi:hypothetical protein
MYKTFMEIIEKLRKLTKWVQSNKKKKKKENKIYFNENRTILNIFLY